MKFRNLLIAASCLAAATLPPASAGDFSLMGSYWDTDVAGETAGGGVTLGLPLNDTFAFELRATYFEQLNDDPFEAIFDSDDEVFRDRGLQALPLEAGVRLSFLPGEVFRPYVGGGASYFMLDSDFGEVKDELGWYAALGATIGDNEGAQFFFEGVWRKASAQVEVDPDELDDIDDIDSDGRVDFDLDGFGANVGVRFTF
jgi:hypothetical protein